MNKPLSRLIVVLLISIPLFLSCSNTAKSPYTSEKASISIVLENSNGQRSATSVIDTVGKLVRIGLSAYLPNYILTVSLVIAKSSADTDTVITFIKSTQWADTQWIEKKFQSAGKRTVTVVAAIQEAPPCTLSAEIIIAAKPVRIFTQPKDSTVDENGSVTFSAVAAGAGPYTYQWYKGDTAISGAIQGSLVINPVLAASAGSYSCVIKDQWGDSAQTVAAVLTVTNVNRPPVPQPQNLSTVQNTAFSIVLTATDPDGDPISVWKIDTLPTHGTCTLTDSTKPNLTYAPANNFIGTDYFTFKAYDGALWSTNSARISIRIDTNKIAPKINQPLIAQTVNKGDSAVFTVGINTDVFPAPMYSWYKDGTLLVSNNFNIFKKTNIVPDDSGYYSVVVSNSVGKDSCGTKLTVRVAPVLTAKLPAATTVVAGAATALSVDIAAGTTPAPAYQWYFNDTVITGATARQYSKTWAVSDAGTYKVVVSNAAGKDSSSTVLSVNVPPSIASQPQSQTVVVGQSVTFSVSATGTPPLSYQWYKNDTAISGATSSSYSILNVKVADTGTYAVTVSNGVLPNATSNGAVLTVNPAKPGPLTYSQNPAIYGVGIAISTNTCTNGGGAASSFSITPALSGGLSFNTVDGSITGKPTVTSAQTVYKVKATNVTGTDSVNLTITVNPTFTVTYNGNGLTAGTCPIDSNLYIQGATVTVKGNTGTLVKTNYTFAGWNIAADGSGATYKALESYTIGNSNVTLYAKWDQTTFYDDFEDGVINPAWYSVADMSESGGNLRGNSGHAYVKIFSDSLMQTDSLVLTTCTWVPGSWMDDPTGETDGIYFLLANTFHSVVIDHHMHESSGGSTKNRTMRVLVDGSNQYEINAGINKYFKMIYIPARRIDCYYCDDGITWTFLYTVNLAFDFIPTYAGFSVYTDYPQASGASFFQMKSYISGGN